MNQHAPSDQGCGEGVSFSPGPSINCVFRAPGHSAGVRDLSLRILEDNVWKVAIMEHVTDPEEQLELIRSAISRARGLRVLNMPSETPDTTTGPNTGNQTG